MFHTFGPDAPATGLAAVRSETMKLSGSGASVDLISGPGRVIQFHAGDIDSLQVNVDTSGETRVAVDACNHATESMAAWMVAVSSPMGLLSTTTHPAIPAGPAGGHRVATSKMTVAPTSSTSPPCGDPLRMVGWSGRVFMSFLSGDRIRKWGPPCPPGFYKVNSKR